MKIGIPKEIKVFENRVGMTPAGVAELIKNNHEVFVETNAGLGSGFENNEYIAAGAKIIPTARQVWQSADMIIKVKEPLESEFELFREGLVVFTFFHLAAEPKLAEALINSKTMAISYDTVQLQDDTLPLLVPMSEVAGKMSIQVGARFLEKTNGGKGILMGGVPGTSPAKVVIIGGGVVGKCAAKIAIGMGASTTILDISRKRLAELDDIFDNRITTLVSDTTNIAQCVKNADLLIGAVLIAGAKSPKLVSENVVKTMQPGSVIVDVAIDQGGCIETIDRVTYHDNPTFVKHGVVHYSVANMPGAVPRTSTLALTSATIPYAIKLANMGTIQACKQDSALAKGINTYKGAIVNQQVANSLGKPYVHLIFD